MNLALAGLGAFVLQGLAFAQDDLLYDEIAQRWLQRNSVAEVKDLSALYEQRFAHLALGVFDVFVAPAALSEPRCVKDTSAGLCALVEVQRGWSAWLAGVEPGERKDDALLKWLRGFSPRTFAAKEAAGSDLAQLAAADVRAALESYRAEQRTGHALGVERELPGVRLVLFPHRSEFVEFTCVAGALDTHLRGTAWNEGLTTWLEYQAQDTRLVTLEYAAAEKSRDFARGVSVGDRNPAAISELVAQVGSRALLARAFSAELDPAIASGLANALVIDLYGELDTRIDGDVRARSSQGRSMFVPGGNPNGGVLPPTSAENRWRGTKGKDHFLGILSQVQKQSAKKGGAKAERMASFGLVSDDGSTHATIQAPFLGASASAPAAAVFPDYLELVRCYGVGFLHWLRLEGAGKPGESAARFGEFLRALGQGTKTEELPKLFEKVYGQPLSAPSADELFSSPTLEGRFLVWLQKRG